MTKRLDEVLKSCTTRDAESIEMLEKKFRQIGNKGGLLGTINYWVGRLRGKTAEDYLRQYDKELDRHDGEVTKHINACVEELKGLKEKKIGLEKSLDTFVTRHNNLVEVNREVKAKCEEMKGLLASFNDMEYDSLDKVFEEYAPSVKEDYRLSCDEKRSRLKEIVAKSKISLEGDYRRLCHRITTLKHEYNMAEKELRHSQIIIDNYETDLNVLVMDQDYLREQVNKIRVYPLPTSHSRKLGREASNSFAGSLKEQYQHLAVYCNWQNAKLNGSDQ